MHNINIGEGLLFNLHLQGALLYRWVDSRNPPKEPKVSCLLAMVNQTPCGCSYTDYLVIDTCELTLRWAQNASASSSILEFDGQNITVADPGRFLELVRLQTNSKQC